MKRTTKAEALEIMQEECRQQRILRDQGDPQAHESVIVISGLIAQLMRLKGEAAREFIESRGIGAR